MKKRSRIATAAIERFEGKFIVEAGPLDTDCHLWIAALTSGKRYPVIGSGTTVAYAHRIAYENAYGPVPDGPAPDGSSRYELHHKCGQKHCVNPDHVQLLSCRVHRALHAELRRAAKESELLKQEQLRIFSEVLSNVWQDTLLHQQPSARIQ